MAALVACGTPSGLPAANASLPQQRTTMAQHLARFGASWMLPETTSDDLVYVSNQNVLSGAAEINVYSFPAGKLVGEITTSTEEYIEGLCSDAKGDVWVLGWTSNGQSFFDEFAHGGTQPFNGIIAKSVPNGCAVESSNNNLAVANFTDFAIAGDSGDLAIYQDGQGNPVDYHGDTIKHYYYCTYDANGDLFATGDYRALNELAKGSGTVRNAYLDRNITPGSIQWDGKDLAVVALSSGKGPTVVDRVTVSGSSAQVIGTVRLQTSSDEGTYLTVQFAIGDGDIIGPGAAAGGPQRAVYFWKYPTGGKDTKAITSSNANFYGVAFSAASK
jgi:hypothetical protein